MGLKNEDYEKREEFKDCLFNSIEDEIQCRMPWREMHSTNIKRNCSSRKAGFRFVYSGQVKD